MKALVAALALFALAQLLFGAPARFDREFYAEQGLHAYGEGQYRRALDPLLAAAHAGDVPSQALLGVMFAFGSSLYPGVPRDDRAAKRWLDRAARGGEPTARYVYCALARGHAAFPESPYCFDRVGADLLARNFALGPNAGRHQGDEQ